MRLFFPRCRSEKDIRFALPRLWAAAFGRTPGEGAKLTIAIVTEKRTNADRSQIPRRGAIIGSDPRTTTAGTNSHEKLTTPSQESRGLTLSLIRRSGVADPFEGDRSLVANRSTQPTSRIVPLRFDCAKASEEACPALLTRPGPWPVFLPRGRPRRFRGKRKTRRPEYGTVRLISGQVLLDRTSDQCSRSLVSSTLFLIYCWQARKESP